MSISSISNTSMSALYSQYLKNLTTSKTSQSEDYSDILSNYYESSQSIANDDGDSYTAGSTQNTLSLYSNNADNLGATIKSFLEKVEEGSVTQDDIDSMQTLLQEAEENGALQAPPPPPSGSITSGQLSTDETTENSISDIHEQIRSFLDKVADGSVTQDDIDNMQSALQDAEENGGLQSPPPPPPPSDTALSDQTRTDDNTDNSTSNINEQIASFLEKIKNGEISDDDILSMQALLEKKG